jgi:hypothetical protein
MVSNNLFPTPIVDKNGRQTTVYRKPERPLEPLRQFPSVSAPEKVTASTSFKDDWELRGKMIFDISTTAHDDLRVGSAPNIIARHIRRFDDDVLERVRECQKKSPAAARRVNARLVELSESNEVSEVAHFAPLISEDILDNSARSMIQSLHYYPQLPKSKDYSQESPEVRSQAEALMRVIDTAIDHGICGWNGVHVESLVIKVEGFTEMVIENKDRVEVIIDFMRDRGLIDVGAIREILSTDVPALSRGVL